MENQKGKQGEGPATARPQPLDLNIGREEQGTRQGSREHREFSEREAVNAVQTLFKKHNLALQESDIPTLKITTPGYPPFPILIILLAVPKDLIDIFLSIPGDTAAATVVGLVFTFSIRIFLTAFTFLVGTVLFFWTLGRISAMAKLGLRGAAGGIGLAMKTQFVKKRVAQGTIGLITECILPFIPFATIFVLLAHYDENKYVKLVIAAAEQIGDAFKSGRIKMK